VLSNIANHEKPVRAWPIYKYFADVNLTDRPYVVLFGASLTFLRRLNDISIVIGPSNLPSHSLEK